MNKSPFTPVMVPLIILTKKGTLVKLFVAYQRSPKFIDLSNQFEFAMEALRISMNLCSYCIPVILLSRIKSTK